jgi:hypothetical protein
MLYGRPEESIAKELEVQPINFGPILEFMSDEFSICLLVAYDEIVTTKSYSADYDKYRSFGHAAFLQWIKLVTRDEAYHYHNAMEVIRLRHRTRIPEIRTMIEGILEVDLSQKEYQGTFVLDHTGPDFSSEFLVGCAKLIKDYF